jgi:hypothetical protein
MEAIISRVTGTQKFRIPTQRALQLGECILF